MKVLVVGATGRTGRLVVDEARAAGHTVRALARSVRADSVGSGVEALAADVCAPGVAEMAVDGMDAVIVALSMVRASDSPWARITTPLDLHTQAAALLLSACAKAGVHRYITVSAHGVGDSRPRAGWAFLGLVHASNIGVAYNNLAQAESIVRAADLEWTIVRPTRLTHGSGTGRWKADPSLVTSSTARISRADLARFLVHNLSDPAWVRTAVSLTQG